MGKILVVDIESCTGCRVCETVCSLAHFGECNPTRSRIKVLRYEKFGEYYINVPVVCQQCETPMCMQVCPVNAISEDPSTGAYIVNTEVCLGCRLCTIACPVGAIEVDPYSKTALKCDLCNGDPLCAKLCAHGAIRYVEEEKVGFVERRESIKKLETVLKIVEGTK